MKELKFINEWVDIILSENNELESLKECYTIEDADRFFNQIFESQEINESFKDTLKSVWNTIKTTISKPIDCVKEVLDKDRELIKKTEENLKKIPKEKLAVLYDYEFEDANIIDDLRDMLSMFKDVFLLRYKHLPWRTIISACLLLAYILMPKNLQIGSILNKYLTKTVETTEKGIAAVGILGGSGIAGNTMDLTTMFMKNKQDRGEIWNQAWKTIENGPDALSDWQVTILDCLDELTIVYLLWKWFKKDLKPYRTWLIAKKEAKNVLADRKEQVSEDINKLSTEEIEDKMRLFGVYKFMPPNAYSSSETITLLAAFLERKEAEGYLKQQENQFKPSYGYKFYLEEIYAEISKYNGQV